MTGRNELIRRVDKLDEDNYSLTLLRAMESILSVDFVVESLRNDYRNDYHKVTDAFREHNLNNYTFFEDSFKKYYSFKEDDTRIDDILINYFIEKKNIEYLKKELKNFLLNNDNF